MNNEVQIRGELAGGREHLVISILKQELHFDAYSLLLKHLIPFTTVGYYKPQTFMWRLKQ